MSSVCTACCGARLIASLEGLAGLAVDWPVLHLHHAIAGMRKLLEGEHLAELQQLARPARCLGQSSTSKNTVFTSRHQLTCSTIASPVVQGLLDASEGLIRLVQ